MGAGRAGGVRRRSAAPRVLPAPARGRRRRRGGGRARRSRVATGAWLVATPFVLLWALSPFIAWRISLPPKLVEAQILSRQETRSLRLIARRTWRFFETFVVEAENFLPPDNFQEDPEPVIAHRTSPTNIGLYLLSTTVAHDFGTIGILDMAKRLEDTLETLSVLRRFRGHLFNWYDTQDLRPLDPIYVSTVDSGNLAGHLIAVAQACHERMQRPLFGPEILEGIRDALELLRESQEEAERPRRTQTVTEAHLREAAEAMEAALEDPPTSLPGWVRRLGELAGQAENLLDIARTLANDAEPEARSEVVAWATSVQDCVASHARDLDAAQRASEPGASPLAQRLSAIAVRAERMVQEMDFRFLFDPSRKLFAIGYRTPEGDARSQLLRPVGLRGEAGKLRGHRQGRCLAATLVSAGPGAHTRRARGRARLLVGLHVRVPDAAARDAAAREQPARSHLPARGRAPDPVRRGALRALGRLRIGPQRSRRGAHLSVLGFRRARSGPQARAVRGRRGRSLRDGARRDAGSQSRARQLRAARASRSPRRLRVLRIPRLHAVEPAGERARGRGAELHGAPPGDAPRLAGERGARRPDPETLSRASDGPGGGAAAAGTDAALGGGDAAPRRRGAGGAARSRPRSPDPAALRIAARHHPPHSSPVQRPLHGHAHGGGLRLQPVERSRAHPLARGHDTGLLGHVRLPARHPDRRGVVGRLPAERSGSRPLRRRVLRGPGQDHAARSVPRHHARGRGLDRGRCRAPPADGDQRRKPGPRDRLHLLCRGRAGAAGRGRGPPRLLEPLRGDGVRARGRDAARDATPALQRRAPDLARSPGGGRGGAGGAAAVRERPRALSGPRPRDPVAALRERRRPLSNTAGTVLDPDREPAAAARDSARRDGSTRLHDARGAVPQARRSRSRRSIASRPRSSGRARWPGRRRRFSCTTCASARTRRISTSVSPIVCCTPIPRRAWRRRCWPRIRAARPGSGPTASRAIFPSPWFASSGTRSATSCASSCARASIGA